MFEKLKTNNVVKNSFGNLPATTAIISNNQIGRYISRDNATILKNVFSATANGFGKAFYQPDEFTVLQDSYAFRFKDKTVETNKIHSYIVTVLNKIYIKYDWNNKSSWNKIKEEFITLPTTKDGKLAFDFMESYIRELEEERIRELAAYLAVSELEDYKLTSKEQEAICLLRENKVKTKEFRIGSLITGQTGDVDLQQKDVNGKGIFFINSGVGDFGIKGKTDRTARTFDKNTITIDFWGNAYYRDFKYKLATHNHVFSYSGEIIKNKEVGLYLCSAMNYLKKIFSYSDMGTMPKIAEKEITLPITNMGEIDYNFMQTYITAIQKLAIKNVVLWKDKQIKATKKIVGLDCHADK